MSHTKRTDSFELELARLKQKLRANTLDSAERERLITILNENTTDSSCIVKAALDEPIFTLRGKDPLAYDAVRDWAENARTANLHDDKTADAETCAYEMALFREKQAGAKS